MAHRPAQFGCGAVAAIIVTGLILTALDSNLLVWIPLGLAAVVLIALIRAMPR